MIGFYSSFAQNAANQSADQSVKQGYQEEKTANGITKGSYINNLKEGCWTSHTNDGKLLKVEHYKAGKLDGIQVEIDSRGYLVGEVYYTDDLIEGTAKRFYYGTNPASMIDYVHGKIDGKKKIYYENSAGKLQEESDFKNDMKNGVSKYYTIKGDLIAEYNYVNNQLQGLQKTFYEGNKVMSEQVYTDNLENGPYKEYYLDGKLKTEGTYTKGVTTGLWKEYSEDGWLKFQGNYINGEKEGKWLEFDASGKTIKTTVFVKGIEK
jgi:antitoxin component YwqK of YwqJK toxin-antitoxin module